MADLVSSNTGWENHLARYMTPSLDACAMFGLDARLWGGVSRVGVPGPPGGKLTTAEAAKIIDILMGRQTPGTVMIGGVRFMVVSFTVADSVNFKAGSLCWAAAASKQAVEIVSAGLAGGTPAQAMMAAGNTRNYIKSLGY